MLVFVVAVAVVVEGEAEERERHLREERINRESTDICIHG